MAAETPTSVHSIVTAGSKQDHGSTDLPELGLIIDCVTAAALVVIVVGIVAALYERRRHYRKSDDRKQLCMSYHAPILDGSNTFCIPKGIRNPSMRPDLVKKIITTDGGVIAIEDIILEIGPGCLAKDTEITLRNGDKDVAIKSLLDLRLVFAAPRVVEYLPDGLKFLKPADLAITFQNTVSDTELFVLHGSYNPIYRRPFGNW